MRPQQLLSLSGRLLIAALVFGLTACGTGQPDHDVPDRDTVKNSPTDQWNTVPAIRQIPANADLFIARSVRPPVPGDVGKQNISLNFNNSRVTLNDLAYLLEQQDISVVFVGSDNAVGAAKTTDAKNGSNAAATTVDSGELEDRKVPFRRYKGSLQGLTTKLKRAMNIAAWWENGALFVANKDRYAVVVPQYQDIMDQVTSELATLGAEQITPSLYSGRIVYTARPSTNSDIIQPYLRSLSNNLAEVTFQLAVVQLDLNDTAERGFDWSSFNIQYGDPGITSATTTNSTTATTGTTGTTAATGTTPTTSSALGNAVQGSLLGLTPFTGTDLTTARTGTSGRLGATINTGIGKNKLGITAAINYLSQFGRTNTKQTIELRTLAGMPVELRSGSTTPYVKSIGATTTPGTTSGSTANNSAGNVTGSVDTATLETGLNLSLTPYYDSSIGLVTVEFDAKVNSLTQFVTLSAGNQLGSITQPSTQENTLNDIVRVPAGEVVILGGIRQERDSDKRTAPYDLFEEVGSSARSKNTSMTFFILRPVVTVYALNDSQSNPNILGEGEEFGHMKKPKAAKPVSSEDEKLKSAMKMIDALERKMKDDSDDGDAMQPVSLPPKPVPAAPVPVQATTTTVSTTTVEPVPIPLALPVIAPVVPSKNTESETSVNFSDGSSFIGQSSAPEAEAN